MRVYNNTLKRKIFLIRYKTFDSSHIGYVATNQWQTDCFEQIMASVCEVSSFEGEY